MRAPSFVVVSVIVVVVVVVVVVVASNRGIVPDSVFTVVRSSSRDGELLQVLQ